MSDNLEVKKYPAIGKDVVIKIEIIGDYYISLKSVFNNLLLEGESKESIGLILDNISNKKITSLKEHRLYLMYVLIVGIENSAKEQGLLTEEEFPQDFNPDSLD
jgi:hypothetical protein